MTHGDMSGTVTVCQAVIVVKALPRPSKKYSETVCCAGVSADRRWRRLYPVRFRQLGAGKFKRWDWVEFRYRRPTNDPRKESCYAFEDSIRVLGELPQADHARLLDPMIVRSPAAAAAAGSSLAVLRPRNSRFRFKRKTAAQIEAERRAYGDTARQSSFLDRELAAFEPTPFAFAFGFKDEDGVLHSFQCGDWETHATFRKWSRIYGEAEALRKLSDLYNDEYPRRGMAFAIGNVLKRPQIWQLLGVLRLDELVQTDFWAADALVPPRG